MTINPYLIMPNYPAGTAPRRSYEKAPGSHENRRTPEKGMRRGSKEIARPTAPERVERFIGIDPGEKTGWAEWLPETEQWGGPFETLSFWQVFDRVISLDPRRVVFVVEDPSQIPFTRRRTGHTATDDRKARNVGAVCREADLLIAGLRRRGFRVQAIKPTSQKRDGKAFRRLTGYDGRTNAHMRDAACLVWGRKR